MVGEKSIVVTQIINFDGQPCDKLIKSLECELSSEMTGARLRGGVERDGTRPVQDQLPTHHQREAPATHQSRGPDTSDEVHSMSW